MPNVGAMAQLSRPYQIALAALGLFALVWFAALHRPGSGPGSGPGSSPSSHAAPAPTASAKAPGASTPVYHGAAPGVAGLTRDIAKAHGAVAQSEQNAQQLQSKSAQASGEATSAAAGASGAGSAAATARHASSASSAGAATARHSTTSAAAIAHKAHSATTGHARAAAAARAQQAAQQAVLQRELRHGRVVLLLFWNPKSTDDAAVRKQVQAVAAHQKGKVAVHMALAGQVGRYGSVTREVQVYQTPTLLVVGKTGLAVTMTGLVDQYAIEQAIREARKASQSARAGA